MGLINNDLPQYGVGIHGPESPGFRERVLLIFAAPPDLEDEDLRYSIVVENQSPQHILNINLVWGPYPRESGAPFSSGAGSSGNPVLNKMLGSLIKPGGQCPWSPIEGHYFVSLRAMTDNPEFNHNQRWRQDLKPRLAASDQWSVGIDYVLFGDGSFVGPDTELQFDQIEASNRGGMDTIAELNRMLDAGDDPFAYAERCASIPWEQIKELYPDPRLYARSQEIVYMWEKRMAAKGMVSQWQVTGKQATIELIRHRANLMSGRILLPERFRPDTTKMDEEAKVRFRASTDLITELNQKLDEGAEGEEIFAHIDRYASISRRQIEALYPDVRAILPNLERNYAISKKAMAMTVTKRRERFGEPAIVEWIRESEKSQIPLVRL